MTLFVFGMLAIFPAGVILATVLLVGAHYFSEGHGIMAKIDVLHLILEVSLLHAAIMSALALAIRQQGMLSDLIGAVLMGLMIVLVPFWAALRLGEPGDKIQGSSVVAYTGVIILFAALTAVFLTYGLVLLPVILRWGVHDFVEHLKRYKDVAALVGPLAMVSTIEFVFFRAVNELIVFVRHRSYMPEVEGAGERRLVWQYRILSALLVAAMGLWCVSYVIYINRHAHPGWVFTPELFAKPVPELTSLKMDRPIERPAWAMIAAAGPPIFLLLLGLFVARRRIPNAAAVLLCLSCLLHAIWALDVLPKVAGNAIWIVHASAWLFLAPVQLDLAVVFPTPSSTLTPTLQKTWKRVRFGLYSSFVAILPFWIYLNTTAIVDIRPYAERHAYWIPFTLLSCAAGLLAFPFFCVLVGYILKQTSQGYNRVQKQIDTAPSSGCLWADLVERRDSDLLNRAVVAARRQVRVVSVGAICSASLFAIWLMILVPVMASQAGASADWVPRAILALFFFSVALAIWQYRLWDIDQIIVLASLWGLVGFVAPTIYQSWQSWMESKLWATLGVLVYTFLAAIPVHRISRWIYSLSWRHKWAWQQKLKTLVLTIADTGSRPVKEMLADACPADVAAAWFFEPVPNSISPDWQVSSIGHAPSCSGDCQQLLAEAIGAAKTEDGVRFGPELRKWLDAPVKDRLDRVLCVEHLLARQESLVPVFSILSRQARWLRMPPIPTSYIHRLSRHRLSMIVRIGGANNLRGVLVIATDRQGDNYDSRDLKALATLAESISAYAAGSMSRTK